jgi:hypothetical protein
METAACIRGVPWTRRRNGAGKDEISARLFSKGMSDRIAWTIHEVNAFRTVDGPIRRAGTGTPDVAVVLDRPWTPT